MCYVVDNKGRYTNKKRRSKKILHGRVSPTMVVLQTAVRIHILNHIPINNNNDHHIHDNIHNHNNNNDNHDNDNKKKKPYIGHYSVILCN